MSTPQWNPLYAFRKPETLAARSGEAHFNTQRDEVMNDSEGLCSIYPGEFRYKPDPTLEIDVALWEDNDHPKALSMYFSMTGKKGYEVAKFDEWEISERLKLAWQRDETGRITLQGRAKNTMVIMFRTAEKADADQKRRLRISDQVQMSAEERQAEMQDKLGSLGARVSVSVVDDDGQD